MRPASKTADRVPSLAREKVSPQWLRHTVATALRRTGVELDMTRVWLGNVRANRTTAYAESDFESKAKRIAVSDASEQAPDRSYHEDQGLMAHLRALLSQSVMRCSNGTHS